VPTADVDVRDLDALDAPPEPRARRRLRRVAGTAGPPLLALLALLGIWAALAAANVKPSYVLPSPASVWSSLSDQWSQGNVQGAIWGSLHRAFLGFALSVAIATPLGLLIGRFRLLRRGVQPLISGLQSLPSVAWVPAAIIWFGLTNRAIYTVVLLGAVPSIINGTISGMDQVPPLFLRVGRILGARGLTLARLVLLPAALPTYLAGLKQGWAFSWRSLMAAELITRSPDLGLGLGQLLDNGRELSDMSLVFASILLILFVGIIVELGLFAPAERRILRNRGLAGG
jgi:NitT/TauT family transport system permease protein